MMSRLTPDRRWMLAGALVIGALGWMNAIHRPAIEGDGIDQVTIGANLVHGRGYLGPDGKVELHFPPLYPGLVGVVSLAVPDLERAGRLVSVVAGAVLVWPVFRLAALAGGPLAARAAVVLLAGTPALAGINSLVGGEGVYTLCVTLGAWALWRAAVGGPAAGAIAGGVFGFAYLARIEALGYLAVLPLLLAWVARRVGATWGAVLARAVAFAVAFLLVASPYVWLVRRETGRWMGSPKFVKVLMHGEAIDPAMQERYGRLSYEAAAYRLGPDGATVGFGAPPDEIQVGGIRYAVRRLPTLTVRYANNLYSLYTRQIWAAIPPVWFALALFGLAASWRRADRAALLAGLGGPFLLWLTFPIARVEPRFLLPQAPLAVVLAAVGVIWLATRAQRMRWALALAGLLAFSYLPDVLMPAVAARWLPYKQEPGAESKAAGLWLREHGGPGVVVMDRLPVVAYYAGARHVTLPFAEPDAVLRYARGQGVTHVVLEEPVILDVRQQLAAWLDVKARGPLEPLYETGRPGVRVIVARLRPGRTTR